MIDVQHTMDFLQPHLRSGSRLLEVGCGEGALAHALQVGGVEVTALEPSVEAAAKARSRGVQVVELGLLEAPLPDANFDAILFGRSLHHIHELDQAFARASELLMAGGLLVGEEFDLEQIDEATARWFYEQRRRLLPEDHLPGQAEDPPLERWRIEHEHDPPLNSGNDMLTACKKRFSVDTMERTAYLYRYFGSRMKNDGRTTRDLFREESQLIETGELLPVGLRWIGRLTHNGR